MNMLRSGHGLGPDVTNSIEPARGRRYPPGALRFRSNQGRQFAGMGPVMRAERLSTVAISARTRRPPVDRAQEQQAGAVTAILGVGLALEALVPWAMIWLSDAFVFDVPAWSRWVVFGAPLVLSIVALGLYLALRGGSARLRGAPGARAESR